LAGKNFCDEKDALLKGFVKNVGIKSFGAKIPLSLEKKVCTFEWCLVLSQKYTKSFGGKKSCSLRTVFIHQKSAYV